MTSSSLNAGALLMTAGKAASLREGAELAREALLSGRGGRRCSTPTSRRAMAEGVLGGIVAAQA